MYITRNNSHGSHSYNKDKAIENHELIHNTITNPKRRTLTCSDCMLFYFWFYLYFLIFIHFVLQYFKTDMLNINKNVCKTFDMQYMINYKDKVYHTCCDIDSV